MRRFPFLCIAARAGGTVIAGAAERVGIAAPLTGPYEVLGRQIEQGAVAAAEAAGAEIVVVDDECTAEGGRKAAARFLAEELAVVVGFLCSEAIEAALPPLTDAGIAVITPGVRATGLTDRRRRTGWLVYRTAPRGDQERLAIGRILARQWQDVPYAILDDGTLYGRDLAESLRFAMEEAGHSPALTETFRPDGESYAALVGRLRQAGIAHAFVGGQAHDIARIGQDAAALGFALVLAGGEVLRTAPSPLPAGTLMIAPAEPEGEAIGRLRAAGGAGYALPALVTVEIALAALRRHEAAGLPLQQVLESETFATSAGSFAFDGKGDLRGDPYRLFRHDGARFTTADP